MKRNMNWGLWMSLLVTVIVFTLKIPTYSKILLLGLFIAGMLYLKRSIFYYVKANRKITSENEQEWDQAWPLYRKAIKAGLQKSFVITSASMFLQRGDALEGKAILEQYLATSKGKDSNLDNIAKTMVSMAYWMDGDLQKAIRTVEEVYVSGYRDKNLFINYTTYALEN
ncbi:MAG: pilus assembly protein PilF, partial [Sphaerochaeta sp.]